MNKTTFLIGQGFEIGRGFASPMFFAHATRVVAGFQSQLEDVWARLHPNDDDALGESPTVELEAVGYSMAISVDTETIWHSEHDDELTFEVLMTKYRDALAHRMKVSEKMLLQLVQDGATQKPGSQVTEKTEVIDEDGLFGFQKLSVNSLGYLVYEYELEGGTSCRYFSLAEVGKPYQPWFREAIERADLCVRFGAEIDWHPHVVDRLIKDPRDPAVEIAKASDSLFGHKLLDPDWRMPDSPDAQHTFPGAILSEGHATLLWFKEPLEKWPDEFNQARPFDPPDSPELEPASGPELGKVYEALGFAVKYLPG